MDELVKEWVVSIHAPVMGANNWYTTITTGGKFQSTHP